MTLDTPVTALTGVGPTSVTRLAQLGIRTVGDLVRHIPRRYEDWRILTSIRDVRAGATVVVRARLDAMTTRPGFRRRLALTRGQLIDETGTLSVVWFGQPWLAQTLISGETYLFRGEVRPDRATGRSILASPVVASSPRLVPIYPETAGLTSKRLREFIRLGLRGLPHLSDPLPARVVRQEGLLSYDKAIREIHAPTTDQRLAAAQDRLAFGELYDFVHRLRLVRAKRTKLPARPLTRSRTDLTEFTRRLDFKLTDDQRRAAWQIIQDIGRRQPMHRLLQGDVGSGKTVVAAFASYVAALSGVQSIWLAPTEILARQHHQTLSRIFGAFGIPVLLRTAQVKLASPIAPNAIIVGTHAVLTDKQLVHPLGLVVIDEQHRFGVEQRELLEKRANSDGTYPHVLMMTATPIPRTYALALYADVDVSVLRDKPPGRTPIQTRVVPERARPAVYTRIRREIALGRQVYVVCPLITGLEEDGTVDGEKKSAEVEYQRLRTDFPDVRIGLLHGRLPAQAKAEVMAEFVAGRVDILVTTAVIEVGVDVPNASVILIEGANRFGLAQLHQLRGRVGRGAVQSTCLLIADQWSPVVAQRLRSLETTDDGFVLAQIDLELRGPGELLGLAQSGLLDFKMASLFDSALVMRVCAALDRSTPVRVAGGK